jgi:hypothetical protein
MMSFDPSIHQLVLFGGACVNNFNCDDQSSNTTYFLEDSAWIAQPSQALAPPPRLGGTLVYDPTKDGLLLFGGASDWTSATTYLNDTWLLSDGNWLDVSGAGLAPPARGYEAGAFSLACNCTVMFGGLQANDLLLNDTWEFGTYVVSLVEHGLPAGQAWAAEVGGVEKTTTSSSLAFDLGNGTYPFAIDALAGYTSTPSSGTIIVVGASAAEMVAFTTTSGSLVVLAFQATGLPAGTNWSVTLTATTSGLTIEAPSSLTRWSNGAAFDEFKVSEGKFTYKATTLTTPGYGGYVAGPGSVSVPGTGTTVTLAFKAGSGPPSTAALPGWAWPVGLALLLIGLVGLAVTGFRFERRERARGRLLMTRISETDWTPDERGNPTIRRTR